MEKTFRTKSGFCHVTTDRIVLTRDGVIGKVAEDTGGTRAVVYNYFPSPVTILEIRILMD